MSLHMKNLKSKAIDFYIKHNFINILSYFLRSEYISEMSKNNIITRLYAVYLNSEDSVKPLLLQMYIKYELLELVKCILNETAITYNQIEAIVTAITNSDSSSLKDYLNTYLDFNHLYSNEFIKNYLERASYIFLNTDLSRNPDYNLIPSNSTFIDLLIKHYDYSIHYNLYNYLLSTSGTGYYTINLWLRGVYLLDSQLTTIDNILNNNQNLIDFTDTVVIKLINNNIIDYIRCDCIYIISSLYKENKLDYNSYIKIDETASDTILNIFKDNYINVTSPLMYSASLLSKINAYGLCHIFMYLKNNNCFLDSELSFLLSRSDCNQSIKLLILSDFSTEEDLKKIDKKDNYSLYIEVFRTVIYDNFIYSILSGSTLDTDTLSHYDTEYAKELSKCTSAENLTLLLSFLQSQKMYNTLSNLIFDKELLDSDYNIITDTSDEFKSALVNNIGSESKKAKSYKLLNHGLFELFDWLVRKSLKDDDCFDFCFTDIGLTYSSYREHLLDLCKEYTLTNNEWINTTDNNIFNDLTAGLSYEALKLISENSFNLLKSNYFNSYSEYTKFKSQAILPDNKYAEECLRNFILITSSNTIKWNILIFLYFNSYKLVDKAGSITGYSVSFIRWLEVYVGLLFNSTEIKTYDNKTYSYKSNFETILNKAKSCCENFADLINYGLLPKQQPYARGYTPYSSLILKTADNKTISNHLSNFLSVYDLTFDDAGNSKKQFSILPFTNSTLGSSISDCVGTLLYYIIKNELYIDYIKEKLYFLCNLSVYHGQEYITYNNSSSTVTTYIGICNIVGYNLLKLLHLNDFFKTKTLIELCNDNFLPLIGYRIINKTLDSSIDINILDKDKESVYNYLCEQYHNLYPYLTRGYTYGMEYHDNGIHYNYAELDYIYKGMFNDIIELSTCKQYYQPVYEGSQLKYSSEMMYETIVKNRLKDMIDLDF